MLSLDIFFLNNTIENYNIMTVLNGRYDNVWKTKSIKFTSTGKAYFVSIDTLNSLVQLEPLLPEQIGRVRYCSHNESFKI